MVNVSNEKTDVFNHNLEDINQKLSKLLLGIKEMVKKIDLDVSLENHFIRIQNKISTNNLRLFYFIFDILRTTVPSIVKPNK